MTSKLDEIGALLAAMPEGVKCPTCSSTNIRVGRTAIATYRCEIDGTMISAWDEDGDVNAYEDVLVQRHVVLVCEPCQISFEIPETAELSWNPDT